MPVLKHISPVAVPVLPKAVPLKIVPSCKIKMAGAVFESGMYYKGFAKKRIEMVIEQIKFLTFYFLSERGFGRIKRIYRITSTFIKSF